MQKHRFLLLLLLIGQSTLSAQQIISHTLIGAKTQAQLTAQFGLPFFQYGARYYKVRYTTPDVYGVTDTVSGLLTVPDNAAKVYPRLVYQHGTSSSKNNVPSRYGQPGGGEGDIPVLFAGMGFVTLAPDYLGLGDSRGFHPYVHAASQAWVAQDMLRAFESLQGQINVHTNDQLFITGYSQGGHAAMALHRAVEQDPANEYNVTAAAHLSGPYSIGEVMRDFILADAVYYYPGYIPNTLLSYQTVYGNLFNQISDGFKQPYAALIEQFYAGQINLGDLNDDLVDLLIATEGACRPTRMLNDSLRQVVATNPNHPVNVALRDNNVYQWTPEAPTRIYYCKADDQVPYLNSLLARDTMLSRSALMLGVADLDSTADHGECVAPALTNTLFFFLGYRQIGDVVRTGEPALRDLISVLPNPADQYVQIQSDQDGDLEVYDYNGRLVRQQQVPAGAHRIDLGDWRKGYYLFVFKNKTGTDLETVLVGG